MRTLNFKFIPYIMWLLPLLFFAHQFILRLWPSLMVEQITHQYSINATEFGMLAAFYYYGYAGLQIPVAILLEKYGAQKIISAFAILAGSAAILFTFSDHFALALLSRFLIGAGSAVGFLGVSKVISQWFPKIQYAKMVGLSFSFGLLGAVYGGKPLNILIEKYNSQNVALAIALVAIGIGVAVYLGLRKSDTFQNNVLPDVNCDAKSQTNQFSFQIFKKILSNPLIWLLAISNMLMVGTLEGFADVWGVPYLMKGFAINKSTAAGLISFIFIGMITGGPLLASLSKKIGHYNVLLVSSLGLALLFVLLLSTHYYSWMLFAALFFIVGNLCCYQVIVFSAGSELVPAHSLGVTIAFLNCVNMLGGSLFHSCIGKLMDLFWHQGVDAQGMRIYDLIAFKKSLMIIPICAIIGAALIVAVGVHAKIQNRKEFIKKAETKLT